MCTRMFWILWHWPQTINHSNRAGDKETILESLEGYDSKELVYRAERHEFHIYVRNCIKIYIAKMESHVDK